MFYDKINVNVNFDIFLGETKWTRRGATSHQRGS